MGRKKNIKSGLDRPASSDPVHPLRNTQVLNKEGAVIPADQLQDKIIGLYFSAHWCPPCQEFTPLLREKYMDIIARKHPFEIVFVSNDKEIDQCNEYYKESMPWAILPYTDRPSKKRLMRLYGITALPTLVLVDKEGRLITKDGETVLMNTPFEKLLAQQQKKLFSCVMS